jgi:hypothetical protein
VDRKRIDVITVWLDNPIHKTILDSKDDGQFRPAVQLKVPYLWVVDLVEGTEMDNRRCSTMLLRRLPNNARGGGIKHLRGLTKKWVKQIATVELSEPVDLKVTVDTVSCFAILVCVDAGGKYKLYSTVRLLT